MAEPICNTWSYWITQKIQEGYSWEDVKHLCVAPEHAEATFNRLQTENVFLPPNLQFSDWPAYIERHNRASRADTLVAIFDRSAEHRAQMKEWLLRHSMRRSTDLDRLWFYEDALSKVERYATGFQIAFISLDDPDGTAIGFRLYECNPDCIICYYADAPRELTPLLHSRPYDFFLWHEGEAGFIDKLDNMLFQVVNAKNMFCYETKKLLCCYPVKNLLYFQSDLKHIHIKTVVGNDTDLYAKLADIETSLAQQGLLNQFIRVHKSFLVNKQLIQHINKQNHTATLVTNEQVPISDAYYKTIIRALGQREAFLPF